MDNCILSNKVLEYAMLHGEKTAVIFHENELTYKDLADRVFQTAQNLKLLGVNKGDRVILSAPSKPEFIIAYLAIGYIQAVAIPVNKSAALEEVEYIAGISSCCLVLSDNPKVKKMEHVVSLNKVCNIRWDGSENIVLEQTDFEEKDICEIIFTSGTTGKPKGAMLSYGAVYANIQNTAEGMDMRQDDILLLPLPLNHSFGLRVLRAALYRGETIVLQNGFTFAKDTTENIYRWGCTCMVCVTAGFEMLREQMGQKCWEVFKNLRYIEFSAGAVPQTLRNELCENLPNTIIYNTWGSTETGGALFLNVSKEKKKRDSAGAPIRDIKIKVIDEKGNEIASDATHTGRLAISGKMLLSGYYKDEELTKKTLCDGWLKTGDAAYIDADGFVHLLGRMDDLISVGGEKVAPIEVEKWIIATGKVEECACIGVPDPKGVLGEIPVVYVVCQSALEEKEISDFVRKNAGSYYVPQAYRKIESIPLNYMGKIDRKKLKELWMQEHRSQDETTVEKVNALEDAILQLIQTRRSIRHFKEYPVEKEKLEKILLAGRFAPSGHNMQTWRFTVIGDKEEIMRIKEVTGQVSKSKQSSFYGFMNPQNLIIVTNDRRNRDAVQDSSAAIENMLLMAHAQKLGACWLNSWIAISDEPEIRNMLNRYGIPKTHIVYGMVALGYPEAEVKMPAKKENVVFYYEGDK